MAHQEQITRTEGAAARLPLAGAGTYVSSLCCGLRAGAAKNATIHSGMAGYGYGTRYLSGSGAWCRLRSSTYLVLVRYCRVLLGYLLDTTYQGTSQPLFGVGCLPGGKVDV